MTKPNTPTLSVVVALLCIAAGPALPVAAAVSAVEIDPVLERLESANLPVECRFEREPLDKVLDKLTRAAEGLDVSGEGCGKLTLISVDYPDMPLKEALARISAATGVEFEVPGPRKLRVICPVPFKDSMTPPERISAVEPLYPREEAASGIGGQVVLRAAIGKNGTVTDVRVLRGVLYHPALDRSAVEAVRQWRYKPALRNGEPVAVYYTIQVDFTPPAKSGQGPAGS